MESSEEDAGTATNASRRESAREKDVGLAEDGGATSSFVQEPSDARPSCQTPAMSEDNFDGDSVPSPSSQDVNTSTEAILDMIDEFVDGPGAPKRLPLTVEAVDLPKNEHAPADIVQESTSGSGDKIYITPQAEPPTGDTKSEPPDTIDNQEQSLPTDEPPKVSVESNIVELQASSSVPESEATVSTESEYIEPPKVEAEVAECPPPNVPSSSEEETVQRISDSNVSEIERTVKCVTSSDNRDNVTVESAESTSSESVSEGKVLESRTRSPLRRRLVRPVVCDRRPDSTVSSTVDSKTVNAVTEQLSSENVTKDVSSSSDAVPTIHGNVKPEEIRNVSEISICKAETSVSPPKKIKLIRQKIITGSNRETPIKQTVSMEKEPCQSTSSDNQSGILPDTFQTSTSDVNLTQSSVEKAVLLDDCAPEEVPVQNVEPISSDDHSQPIVEQSTKSDDIEKIDEQPIPSVKLSSSTSETDTNTSSTTQEAFKECALNSSERSELIINDQEQGKKCDEENTKETDLEPVQKKVLPLKLNLATSSITTLPSMNCEIDNNSEDDQKKVPPIKLNLSMSSLPELKLESEQQSSISKSNIHEETETKQVPKLTIKLKQPDEMKSPVPKLTIKPIRPPVDQSVEESSDNIQPVPSVTKLNIKPIPLPSETNEKCLRTQQSQSEPNEQIPCITKLNIKPIPKPPEKINDIHRKSSSSEISESEYSENDESTSTSDQASASEQGPSDVVPKVTIKLGKPGTHSEGMFYTEKNVPKLTIKGIQQDNKDDQEHKIKMVISQSEDKQPEKIPKLTIKTVTKSDNQPLSPKLTIKPLKPPDTSIKESEISKMKVCTESFSSSEARDTVHVPKITIKPVIRPEADTMSRTPKKSAAVCDNPEHIPVVTKLNIKPILKPTECGQTSEGSDDKVPVVSKLNIKPVIKPKDNDIDTSVDDVPKITKLNIKPLKNPEENSSEAKDCDELNADIDENSIPVVTKLNIKPIVKPQEEESLKDAENQSSETGNSSDDNTDHIPVVTKLNIKPIVKPDNFEESSKSVSSTEPTIPVITKLNIKPLVKPGDSVSPSSPKKESTRSPDLHSTNIPVITKLNIKPVVKPEVTETQKPKDDLEEKSVKNPPLVMKINMKSVIESSHNDSSLHNEHSCNNISEEKLMTESKTTKFSELEITKLESITSNKDIEKKSFESDKLLKPSHSFTEKPSKQNCTPDVVIDGDEKDRTSIIGKSPITKTKPEEQIVKPIKIKSQEIDNVVNCNSSLLMIVGKLDKSKIVYDVNETHTSSDVINASNKTADVTLNKQKISPMQNCTLLKKLLENTKEVEAPKQVNCNLPLEKRQSASPGSRNVVKCEPPVDSENCSAIKLSSETVQERERRKSPSPEKNNDTNLTATTIKMLKNQDVREVNENITKPLEITISDKISNQGSGQDSPRIILKINKTDLGSSAKIITEDVKRPDILQQNENTQDILNDKSPKRQLMNSRRKQATDLSLSAGKRLRSSRIVENAEKPGIIRRSVGKRSSISETSPPLNKEPELSVLQSKRLKLGQLLSGNKSLTITPVSMPSQTSPTKTGLEIKQGVKTVNHSLLHNENCSKNGNSKLHNILSNLQAKQMQSLSFNNTNCSEKSQSVSSAIELNNQQSTGSSDTVEITHVENSHPELQEMIINENSDFRDLGMGPEESSQDPLEVASAKPTDIPIVEVNIPKAVEMTPQPKKRGRPRKLPVSEGAKPVTVTLPVTALEERPQRSLRLMRDRPAILSKPRGGRGRGRGGRRSVATPPAEPEPVVVIDTTDGLMDDRATPGEIDPTSSRIKLPRMTEALDKMPSVCTTPLSSRRRNSSSTFETPELKVVLENTLPKLEDSFSKSPEASGSGSGVARGRGSRGGRGGRGRTPRGRGRGRGGGRGAMYMKETMGIYGRVCGPATTTVQLFEEETCMMDDNATPAKPSHLLDEDSQSSVRSSTNESSKMKKSKFADLFDSNKIWTAADVKEYMWPPPERPGPDPKVMMIQEQVAMFLGVKSFKRRYPELQRRTIVGEERDYALSKGIVTEALCDLGITAVDASEVLDIMLSDYPHKYEEYRSHQRERQLNEVEEVVEEVKTEEKVMRVEMKVERITESKPEVPKIDPEKTRQDMAAAAVASAGEWNARATALRRGFCADLQSLTVLRPRRAPPPRLHVRPPAGFYPHALLPGQHQHCIAVYTPDQLRYFPLNTAMAAPAAPPSAADSSSESDSEWPERYDSSTDDEPPQHAAKRKKLSKARSSQADVIKTEPEEEVDTCRVCKLRLEANRKYTHERFLVCSQCNAKLHPGCAELGADTIRKCREYSWQCAACKTCGGCGGAADHDKMLFCDLCDRGFHSYCVGLPAVPQGRWHCVECAICKSCGARDPSGAGGGAGAGAWSSPASASASASAPGGSAEWHHQTRRGPGGHKVYSHSLCTPCARAYRIGRYCPLCERSFIGPKGTMQLVICKLCDRQLHQDCVKQTVSQLKVLDYTCAECRRGGITSRAAAVRLAPRTIATLFMAKRRFNKYAHRQYLASRRRDPPTLDAADASEASDGHDADASDPLDGA